MRTSLIILLASVLLLVGVAAAAAGVAPVTVAVDASRSLSAADLNAIRATLESTVAALPDDVPVGLVTFNDEARSLLAPTTDRAAFTAALAGIVPQGSYTVLNDALFLAARSLADGGVVLLVTDGRDENSATTVEDVAGLTVANHVRVVALSSGHTVDERALRRFSLLTKGGYLGPAAGADAGAVAATVATAGREVAEEVAAAASSAPLTPPIQPIQPIQPVSAGPEQTAVAPAPATGLLGGVLPWLVALLLAATLAAVLWWFVGRRGGAAASPERRCERCGAPMEGWETSCAHCALADLGDVVNSTAVARRAVPTEAPASAAQAATPTPSDESVLDPAVFAKRPLPFNLEQTMVLDEQAVLEIKQRGKPPRTYTLPEIEVFAVGRAPGVNTLQLDDPTISGQHFKVVPKDGDFYVVDLGATNGTQVNHERVKVRKLHPGDVISVGQVEFEFKMKVRRVS